MSGEKVLVGAKALLDEVLISTGLTNEGFNAERVTIVDANYVVNGTDSVLLVTTGGITITYDAEHELHEGRKLIILNPYMNNFMLNTWSISSSIYLVQGKLFPSFLAGALFGGGGVSNFIDLDDTPAAYGLPHRDIIINDTSSGLTYVDRPFDIETNGRIVATNQTVKLQTLLGPSAMSSGSLDTDMPEDTIVLATGTNTDIIGSMTQGLFIGDSITSNNQHKVVALGRDIDVMNGNSVLIGNFVSSNGYGNVAIGNDVQLRNSGVAVGYHITTDNSNDTIILGTNIDNTSGSGNILVGKNISADGNYRNLVFGLQDGAESLAVEGNFNTIFDKGSLTLDDLGDSNYIDGVNISLHQPISSFVRGSDLHSPSLVSRSMISGETISLGGVYQSIINGMGVSALDAVTSSIISGSSLTINTANPVVVAATGTEVRSSGLHIGTQESLSGYRLYDKTEIPTGTTGYVLTLDGSVETDIVVPNNMVESLHINVVAARASDPTVMASWWQTAQIGVNTTGSSIVRNVSGKKDQLGNTDIRNNSSLDIVLDTVNNAYRLTIDSSTSSNVRYTVKVDYFRG